MLSASATAGLTSQEARERLVLLGPNELPSARPTPAWRQLGAQLLHFFALLLWGAGTLAIVAGMVELGVAILTAAACPWRWTEWPT
jgi:magnesium-transporting ATPase (P-type)